MSMELHVEEILENHTRLNEKQRKLEEAVSISIEEYKSKILCLQCSKESEKIKCQECSNENIQKRNTYLIFSGSWTITSIIVFFSSNVCLYSPISIASGGMRDKNEFFKEEKKEWEPLIDWLFDKNKTIVESSVSTNIEV
jgi:uncharacterized paraquat-inducible protein A